YNNPPQLLYRNLLYTAVTRAKKLLILVGKTEIAEHMIRNNKKATFPHGARTQYPGRPQPRAQSAPPPRAARPRARARDNCFPCSDGTAGPDPSSRSGPPPEGLPRSP
ncbi:MAG: ATP-binding domain-containing protein, partial [Firmicutes bacterium]|nr:ATP-binding domain-containing protein [Bacillota bacterium]